MRLKRPVVFLLLLALFIASLVTRTATRDRLESPYFKGGSAMVYAHGLDAAGGIPLDTITSRANWPYGYTPARYRADGFETAWARAYRAARFVSEVDGRDFARRTTMFLAALCVFTMYALARRIWVCQGAGLLAAFLTAFLAPFVLATNGRVFTHTTLAPMVVSAHAALVLVALGAGSRRSGIVRAIGAALAALALAVSWEPGLYVIAIWTVSLALTGRGTRTGLLVGHALAVLVACVLSPNLVATRAIGSPATTLVVASAVLAFAPARVRGGWRDAVFVFVAAIALWIVMTPVRAGATEQFPALSYLVTRARYLFGRPESPSDLSDWMRHVWSLDHAPLPPYLAIALFVPIALLGVALALNAELRARRTFVAAGIVGAVAIVATLADRSALPVSALVLIAIASGGAHSWAKNRVRAALVILAAVIAFTAVVFPAVVFRGGPVDASYQVGRLPGVSGRDPHSFLWVSFENTDRELVRFVATRTSVRESILAPDDLSALLLAFTGRAVVALPSTTSHTPAERRVELTRAMYGSEEELFAACRGARIDYVVYSIDLLLDTGRYSPRYQAAVTSLDPASIAYRMHFEPESLRRFTLLYENDHYRLFDVTGEPQPIFATDHPPFYQTDLLVKAKRDVDAFRQLAVNVMLTYSEAVNARLQGNAEGARRRLEWCLLQAPRYTMARLALADALVDLGRSEDARRVIVSLLAYAPDNTHALYYAAYLSAQLNQPEEAKSYLTLLLSIESDPDLIQRARNLQSAVERGIPVRAAAPADG